MTTLTKGATTITPTIVDGYSTTQSARTILHDIIGRSNPDVSFAADSLRSGSLRCMFVLEADADAARDALAQPGVWTLADAARSSIGMLFVRQGDMTVELDDETRELWVLTLGYQEVLA